MKRPWLGASVAALALVAACGTNKPFDGDAGADAAADGPDASGCSSSQTSCSGKCVDTQTSATDCGGCGRMCSTGESCCAGSCTSDPGCGLEVASIAPDKGYVNGGAWVTITGKGFAAGLRAFIGDGRAPARVIDATTALVLAPPSVIGLYSVRVEVGSATATLPAAFTYRTEGFEKQWTEVSMSTPRGNFPAMTTLQDGRVLIVGGTSNTQPSSALASAEIYDPQTHGFTPTQNSMTVPRYATSAITLLDGRALIVGTCNIPTGTGCQTAGDRAIADLFDPTTNSFTEAKGTVVDTTRVYMRPILLPDGRVLITSNGEATAEMFDPATEMFTTLNITSQNSQFGFPTRLRDGRVVFLSTATSEIYDPDAGTLSPLNAPAPHGVVAALTLPDGRVMSPGGADLVNGDNTPTDAIAIVDVGTPQVTTLTETLSSPRLKFASAVLGDGTAMVAGGVDAAYPITYGCQSNTFPTTNAVDTIDPSSGHVVAFPALNDDNMELVAATLLDGSIIVGGGSPCNGAGAYPYVYFLQSIPPPN
jgi:hypothetical protein